MSLTRKAEELLEKNISALKRLANEDGRFYQRKAFLDHIENFLKVLRDSIEKVGQRRDEIDKLLEEDSSEEDSSEENSSDESRQALKNKWAAIQNLRAEKNKWTAIQTRNKEMLRYTLKMMRNVVEEKKSAQMSMYQYGLKMRKLFHQNEEAEFNAEAKRLEVQTLIFDGTGFDLDALDSDSHTISLVFLDKEIKRAKDLNDTKNFPAEKKEQYSKFINSLNTLRNTVSEDLEGMKEAKYSTAEIRDSESSQLAMNAAYMLEQMSYEEENINNDREIAQKQMEQLPTINKSVKFFKAAGVFAAMISSVLGFIAGAAYGFVLGAVHGAKCCLIGAVPGAIVSAVVAGGGTAECVYEGVKKLVDIPPYESVKRHLLFQPGAKEAAQKASQKTLTFFNPPPAPKPKEKSASAIDSEVLGRYFANR